jgi:hypothetical protein
VPVTVDEEVHMRRKVSRGGLFGGFVLVVVLFGGGLAATAAGSTATVTGTVQLDGQQLPDVALTIVIADASDLSLVGTVHLCTAADGTFAFNDLPTDPGLIFSLFTGPDVFCENKKFFDPAPPRLPLVSPGPLFYREPLAAGQVRDVGAFSVERLPDAVALVVGEARGAMAACFDELDPPGAQAHITTYRTLVDQSAGSYTAGEFSLLGNFEFTVSFFLANGGCHGWFSDDDTNVFEIDIEWMADQGITRGCNPPTNDLFCPDSTVTRGQMAAFLVRALDLTDDGGGDLFTDDDESIFEGDIDRMATAGITKGCNPPDNDRFCPDSKVTRGQMAAFLVRALGYTDDGGGDLFTDDDGSVFEGDIDRLGTAGVTRGCNPPTNDRYCPDSAVTRGQMAAFLHRALG